MPQYGKYRASFDLTDFGETENFESLLEEFDMMLVEEDDDGFLWESVQHPLALKTCNNPITGIRAGRGKEPEEGYASYMHITGESQFVHALCDQIEHHAVYIKGQSRGEWSV